MSAATLGAGVHKMFLSKIIKCKRKVVHIDLGSNCKMNKFALLWGEAQLCLPYVYLQNEKSNDPI